MLSCVPRHPRLLLELGQVHVFGIGRGLRSSGEGGESISIGNVRGQVSIGNVCGSVSIGVRMEKGSIGFVAGHDPKLTTAAQEFLQNGGQLRIVSLQLFDGSTLVK